MGFSRYHLWGEIVECSADGLSSVFGEYRPAKIANFNAVDGNKYILGFDVAMDDAVSV
jgi:hypothetical protein